MSDSHAEVNKNLVEDAITNALHSLAMDEQSEDNEGFVDYQIGHSDGPYIIFDDGSSISISVTTQEA